MSLTEDQLFVVEIVEGLQCLLMKIVFWQLVYFPMGHYYAKEICLVFTLGFQNIYPGFWTIFLHNLIFITLEPRIIINQLFIDVCYR